MASFRGRKHTRFWILEWARTLFTTGPPSVILYPSRKHGEPAETSPLHIPMTYHRPILAALTLAAILCLAWCVHPSVAPAAGRESWRALERFAERWHGLDRGLLKRASTMETDNRDLGCVKDANGCSCSRYQIYLPDCPAVVAEALTKSRALAAWWAAWRLAESKRRCTRAVLLVIPGQEPKRRCVCDWTFWNAGAEDEVCAKLAAPKGDET